jgi:hypothetical protein
MRSPASDDAIKVAAGSAIAEVFEKNAPCQTKAIANIQNSVVAIQRFTVESCFVK